MPTVLVVDDALTVRKYTEMNLKKYGFTVLQAEDGPSGFAKARKTKPDLILLDLMMTPEMDGFQVLQLLKNDENTKAIPVVIASGRGGKDDIKKAISLGAVDYIVKPFNEKIMLDKVRRALVRQNREKRVAPPPIAAAVEFFAAINNVQTGPFSREQLADQVAEGKINAETLVWYQGMGEWQRASSLDELAELFSEQEQ